jgi:hypothetical protein
LGTAFADDTLLKFSVYTVLQAGWLKAFTKGSRESRQAKKLVLSGVFMRFFIIRIYLALIIRTQVVLTTRLNEKYNYGLSAGAYTIK